MMRADKQAHKRGYFNRGGAPEKVKWDIEYYCTSLLSGLLW